MIYFQEYCSVGPPESWRNHKWLYGDFVQNILFSKIYFRFNFTPWNQMWKHKNVLPLVYPQLSNSTFEFGEWFKPDNYLFIYSENLQIVMIIALFGLGEATLGLTRKEANVSGGIAITLFVVTFSILVFILNRFDVSHVIL